LDMTVPLRATGVANSRLDGARAVARAMQTERRRRLPLPESAVFREECHCDLFATRRSQPPSSALAALRNGAALH
jgi:hypothetical protein